MASGRRICGTGVRCVCTAGAGCAFEMGSEVGFAAGAGSTGAETERGAETGAGFLTTSSPARAWPGLGTECGTG